jgi:hypothetical protein
MHKPLLCLSLLVLTLSQQCQVCAQVKQCDSSLFNDANIDPIYNSLIQQIQIQGYPTAITRLQDKTNSNYTFTWPSRVFLATVNLNTRAYTVVETTPASSSTTTTANVEAEQSALGIRGDSLVNNQSELIARIDSDIRKKYSYGSDVKCLSITPVKGGYHATYQKKDGTVSSIDSAVQTNGNNVMISYQMC